MKTNAVAAITNGCSRRLGRQPLSSSRFPPADQFRVAAHYSKREARIRMRDGVQLFTIIYELKAAPSGIHF